MRAGDIMTRRVVTVGEDATLAHAAHLLGTAPEATLQVVDAAGHLVGILTATHLLERIRIALSATDLTAAVPGVVADAMTTPVLAMRAETDIEHVAAALADTDTYAVPVVDGFTPIGTITRLELVRALTGAAPTATPPPRNPS
ncbi:CBS domain-containing protein [Rhodococcus sp. ACT016]|uniref:CBS domain-containing protein n=1 Tax=Rhodococcus sp. ACT016 TaxID=3134808 RepID=UPI003D2C5EF5